MADEIELKLALAEADQPRFLRHPRLRHAAARHVDTLDNIYYDTPDLALRRRGIALRLRRQGRRWLQTVKLAGSASVGLSSRPEWETPYGGHFDFSVIEVESVREWLQRPKLLARIVPIFETRFRRNTWHFAVGGGDLLLTLDRGWIVANGRREAISELELELSGAPVQAIFDIALALGERIALPPAVLSKAERGYRLHAGTALAPVKAATIPLTGDMAPEAAFRRIALDCLEHLQRNHIGALTHSDPEYIHQMRVATRRLRAALRLFAPVLASGADETLRAPLAELMTRLGRARDLDVLQTEITDPVLNALPDEPRLTALASDITNRRYGARDEALAALAAPAYGQALLVALQALHSEPGTTLEGDPLATFATRRLRRLRRKVLQLAAAARIDDPVSLHALRIGIKRLRYGLEFFSPLAKRSPRAVLKRLAALQETLGQLNDLANAGTLLMDCAADDPRLREAVTLIAGWHGPRHASLLTRIPPELARLARLRLPTLN